MSIRSELITLSDIVETNSFFTIPIYQRMYVWGDDQVRTLLSDLLTAYQEKKDIFYLGSILVVEGDEIDNGRNFELIDGQQRLTTLWMMSLVWQRELKQFQYRQGKYARQFRVTFSIRPEINKFFAQWMDDLDTPLAGNHLIVDTLATIESFPKEHKDLDLEDFTRFIFEKVQMVVTNVPDETDLNKLFEVINNRGVQLHNHEILKVRMLSALENAAERERYSLLWDACSYMLRYVEKNLKEITNLKISTLFDNEKSIKDMEALACASNVLDMLKQQQADMIREEALSLEEIISMKQAVQETKETSQDEEIYESDDVRSIITFPMLLQHTLRIWLHKHEQPDLPKILDKELLSLFEDHFRCDGIKRIEAVTSFIELLWEIRYCFDKYIIKWVGNGEEEYHLICKLRLNPSTSKGKTYYSLVRQQPATNEGFALLQSMLYHSQQITTHYWLTPLLAYIHDHPGEIDQHYAYLMNLDNHMFCSIDADSLIVQSWSFLKQPWKHNELIDASTVLAQPLGVNFPHYWFYKLEFVLWFSKLTEITGAHKGTFRMTAKNSVEHIWPRNPETGKDPQWVEELDCFGNLGLVSRSLNSEYGRKPYHEKKAHFQTRNKDRIDSLKMFLVYDQNEEWTPKRSQEHQQQMIKLIDNYLKRDLKGDAHA
ncbi:DUF262 domain-containing protein [Methanosarcina sp. DH2]|uniref:DUF262 domain-containing protein n=1 Tax=Methanosarcina sp. DH2 TaxID=2605639 RepID=UPI001E3BFB51|nr:DUF262 domain-containing protein [Methanosarcina sp. DH2]MCC4771139.1 DUF262 domain-containing protein [Methanosarcina sp. DH2]